MIKELIKIASELDAAGFTKEADQVDAIIRKIAGKPSWSEHQWSTSEDSFERTFADHKAYHGGASLEDTIAYNSKKKNSPFDPKKVKKGQGFWLLCDNTCGA